MIRVNIFTIKMLSLKADELQFGQRSEDVERKREFYHIIIFPETT